MDNGITYMGRTNFRNSHQLFGIKDKDRLQHIYCLGKSGVGKSTLLKTMAISDLERGNGLCVIDPHGDVATDLLEYIPKDRESDLLYFNTTDREPLAFNPIKGINPKYQYLVASGLISTFKKIWHESWGPRMEYILRFALLTLMELPDATLLDIQPLLVEKDFRTRALLYVTDKHVLSFWENEFDKYSPSFRSEAISPILNKVGLFRTSNVLRNIVGQKTRGFRLQQVLDEGKILICNFSKGQIGEEVCSLLGSMLLTAIQLSALHRATQASRHNIQQLIQIEHTESDELNYFHIETVFSTFIFEKTSCINNRQRKAKRSANGINQYEALKQPEQPASFISLHTKAVLLSISWLCRHPLRT